MSPRIRRMGAARRRRVEAIDGLGVALPQVVEDDDVVPGRGERSDGEAADEAGPACHQDASQISVRSSNR
jgi:hypothetical protein